jgi:hypothetical protein
MSMGAPTEGAAGRCWKRSSTRPGCAEAGGGAAGCARTVAADVSSNALVKAHNLKEINISEPQPRRVENGRARQNLKIV